MHGFIDALRVPNMINCGQFAEHDELIFAFRESSYSTLSYSEMIMVDSDHES